MLLNDNSTICTIALRKLTLLTIGLFFSIFAFGQSGSTSPLSSFGLGDINSGAFGSETGMGQAGIALRRPGNINFMNPASYSAVQLTTFESGLRTGFRTSSYMDSTATRNESALSHFAFAFPIMKNWGGSFGIVPYCNTGYKMYAQSYDSIMGNVRQQYEASGGLSQFYLGSAVKFSQHFSVGANAAVLFGSLDRIRTQEFPDLTNAFNARISNTTAVLDILPTVGVQYYTKPLRTALSDSLQTLRNSYALVKEKMAALPDSAAASKDSLRNELTALRASEDAVVDRRKSSDWVFHLGAVMGMASTLNAHQSILAERYRYSQGLIISEDTTDLRENIATSFSLPPRIGVGLGLSKGESWSYALDVTYQDWSAFTSDNGLSNLKSSMQVNAGIEHSPDPGSPTNYLKRIHYRAGVRYAQTALSINGEQVGDYAFTLGAGFPLRKSASMIHCSGEIGTRRTTDIKLVNENYVRLNLAFTLCDRWFQRRKFD